MKSILSPYDDEEFNAYLLNYVKKYFKSKCAVFTKDDEDRKYFLEGKTDKYYTYNDVINTLELRGRVIGFSNRELINHVVYDLSQRFWYEGLKCVNNLIPQLYIKYKGTPSKYNKNLYRRNK